MATVLQDIKELLEVDVETTIYDDTLLGHINTGMAFLKSNAVPVDVIDAQTESTVFLNEDGLQETDYQLVKDWLYFHCLQRFDASTMSGNRSTSTAYNTWIEGQMTSLLFSLKARYGI